MLRAAHDAQSISGRLQPTDRPWGGVSRNRCKTVVGDAPKTTNQARKMNHVRRPDDDLGPGRLRSLGDENIPIPIVAILGKNGTGPCELDWLVNGRTFLPMVGHLPGRCDQR